MGGIDGDTMRDTISVNINYIRRSVTEIFPSLTLIQYESNGLCIKRYS